jgi:hypothetical protein
VIAALAKNMANKELAEMGDLKEAGAIAVSDDAFSVQDAEFFAPRDGVRPHARAAGLAAL